MRSLAILGGGTALAAVLGLGFQSLLAYWFGATAETDAFFMSLSIFGFLGKFLMLSHLRSLALPVYARLRAADAERARGLAGGLLGLSTAAVAVLGLPGGWTDAGPGDARLPAFAVPAVDPALQVRLLLVAVGHVEQLHDVGVVVALVRQRARSPHQSRCRNRETTPAALCGPALSGSRGAARPPRSRLPETRPWEARRRRAAPPRRRAGRPPTTASSGR